MRRARFATILLWIAVSLLMACGDKKPRPKDGTDAKADAADPADVSGEEKAAAEKTKGALASWLGDEASAKVSGLASGLAKDLAAKISNDKKVLGEIGKLSGAILKEPSVKKQTDKIADKATSGFLNKVKLGWKALQAGGVDEYKKKVKENTTRIATEVINEHIETVVLKDPRMAELIKKFTPLLQIQAKVSAISLQQNLSPQASQKLFGIALKMSVAGKSDQTARKMEEWTKGCDGKVEAEIEKLFAQVVELDSLSKSLQGLAVEVIGHERTAAELAVMMTNIMKDKVANKAMTKAYENAAFDNGDKAIRGSIEKIVKLPVVDDELFSALDRLATAQGASGIMEKHLAAVGEDPEMAKLVDGFILGLLDTCGDPIK